MAEEQVKDLFGDSDDSDAEPQQPAGEGLEDSDAGPQQQDARQTAANLFGSSDEEDEAPGPSHPVTQARGDDEDEYRRHATAAGRPSACLPACRSLLCLPGLPVLMYTPRATAASAHMAAPAPPRAQPQEPQPRGDARPAAAGGGGALRRASSGLAAPGEAAKHPGGGAAPV